MSVSADKKAEERRQDIIDRFAKVQTSEEAMPMYDLWAENYNEDVDAWGYYLDKHLDEFEDFVRISKDARILDVAAGTGLVGQKLKERGYTNVEALDGSIGMVEYAQSRNIYKNYFHILLGPQPVPGIEKDTYDALICVGGLHSKLVDERCFKPLAEITKPGGHIFFLTGDGLIGEARGRFEDTMRELQEAGIWRWVLMKESPDKYFKDHKTIIYAFKLLK